MIQYQLLSKISRTAENALFKLTFNNGVFCGKKTPLRQSSRAQSTPVRATPLMKTPTGIRNDGKQQCDVNKYPRSNNVADFAKIRTEPMKLASTHRSDSKSNTSCCDLVSFMPPSLCALSRVRLARASIAKDFF